MWKSKGANYHMANHIHNENTTVFNIMIYEGCPSKSKTLLITFFFDDGKFSYILIKYLKITINIHLQWSVYIWKMYKIKEYLVCIYGTCHATHDRKLSGCCILHTCIFKHCINSMQYKLTYVTMSYVDISEWNFKVWHHFKVNRV